MSKEVIQDGVRGFVVTRPDGSERWYAYPLAFLELKGQNGMGIVGRFSYEERAEVRCFCEKIAEWDDADGGYWHTVWFHPEFPYDYRDQKYVELWGDKAPKLLRSLIEQYGGIVACPKFASIPDVVLS